MYSSPADTDIAVRPPRIIRSAERGFSLVELLVVMVIISILMAIGFNSFMAAKKAEHVKQAIEVAQTYSVAVDQFMLAHRGRTPKYGDPNDWYKIPIYGPASIVSRSGPNGAGDIQDPYIRKPKALDNIVGAAPLPVGFGTSDTSGTNRAAVVYKRVSDTSYVMQVYNQGKLICVDSNDASQIPDPKATCK